MGLGGLGHMGVKIAKAIGAKVTVLIVGIREAQEMLDFCSKHGVVSDVEVIPIQKINEAYERVLNSDVHYRFVIDMASMEQPCSK